MSQEMVSLEIIEEKQGNWNEYSLYVTATNQVLKYEPLYNGFNLSTTISISCILKFYFKVYSYEEVRVKLEYVSM